MRETLHLGSPCCDQQRIRLTRIHHFISDKNVGETAAVIDMALRIWLDIAQRLFMEIAVKCSRKLGLPTKLYAPGVAKFNLSVRRACPESISTRRTSADYIVYVMTGSGQAEPHRAGVVSSHGAGEGSVRCSILLYIMRGLS